MSVLFSFLGGLVIGVLIMLMSDKIRRCSGTLKIDMSNPEKDLFRFDIDDLDNLYRKKKVVLKVDSNANLSRQ